MENAPDEEAMAKYEVKRERAEVSASVLFKR